MIKMKKNKQNDTLYIAGKVTGLWRWWVVLKFTVSKWLFTSAGFKVVSPIDLIKKDEPWISAMTICLIELKKCDFVYFQFDWAKSDGAKMEFEAARREGKMLMNRGRKIRREYFNMSL